ncbi:hypothetical protein GCM10009122_42250 [Fulvivirga kasyanovii]
MLSPEDFWNWFSKNKNQFFFLNQIDNPLERERLLDIFLIQLHSYCNHLYFKIGGHPDETQDLIITAEGDSRYFNKVEELVKHAPKFKDWNILVFKPPKGTDFNTTYKGITLNPNKLWFLPLENKKQPSQIGIKVCIEGYKASLQEDFLTASYLVLDEMLGEKSSALDIHHVEVGPLPNNPEDNGLIEFIELADYIKWKKTKLSKL